MQWMVHVLGDRKHFLVRQFDTMPAADEWLDKWVGQQADREYFGYRFLREADGTIALNTLRAV